MSSNSGNYYGWIYHQCWENAYFICQTEQRPHPSKVEVIYQPQIVFPMDNLTYEIPSDDNAEKLIPFVEHLISFPHEPVFQTELNKPAQFFGTDKSYLEIENIEGGVLHLTSGLTLCVWVCIKSIEDGTKATIVDFSENYGDKSFRLYLEKSDGRVNVVAETCNFDCSDISIHRLDDVHVSVNPSFHLIDAGPSLCPKILKTLGTL